MRFQEMQWARLPNLHLRVYSKQLDGFVKWSKVFDIQSDSGIRQGTKEWPKTLAVFRGIWLLMTIGRCNDVNQASLGYCLLAAHTDERLTYGRN